MAFETFLLKMYPCLLTHETDINNIFFCFLPLCTEETSLELNSVSAHC